MPAPLAKGIVVTVTVLVAAGIAVYESPQVKQWIQTSRRRLAVALHNLGDDINPERAHVFPREDISMTEDIGVEAEQRRQRAREEIIRRHDMLKARQRKVRGRSSSESFDDLVDGDGHLKQSKSVDQKMDNTDAVTTGVEIAESSQQPIQRQTDGSNGGLSRSMSEIVPQIDPEHRRAILESIDRDRLHITTGLETPSNHPSESLVDLTPTSEHPGTDFGTSSIHSEQNSTMPEGSHTYEAAISSTATEDGEPDFYYAHPHQSNPGVHDPPIGPEAQVSGHQGDNASFQEVSSAPSIASSLSHIEHIPFDDSSDGTMSDFGQLRGETYTPVSWSEVSSVVSNDDANYH